MDFEPARGPGKRGTDANVHHAGQSSAAEPDAHGINPVGRQSFVAWIDVGRRKTEFVAAVGTGTLFLAATGLLQGRRTAAYPALAPDVRAAGGEFVDSEAVVDGVMVSARAWPDHPAWMREFIGILRAKSPA